MLDEKKLTATVGLQKKTYKLLSWLETAIDKGFVHPSKAREHASAPDAAADWVSKHFLNLPPACRPDSTDEKDIRPFATMLSSYLMTSFDIAMDPGQRLFVDHCPCPMCSFLIAAPHFRPKKVSKADKKRARKLKLSCLRQLAKDRGVCLDDKEAQEIMDDLEFREAVSMVTYGNQLILRSAGHIEGPAILALWREFAWHRTGSPKKEFQLEANEILQCEKQLVHRLSVCPGPADCDTDTGPKE